VNRTEAKRRFIIFIPSFAQRQNEKPATGSSV
jgi:hypothetical protein